MVFLERGSKFQEHWTNKRSATSYDKSIPRNAVAWYENFETPPQIYRTLYCRKKQNLFILYSYSKHQPTFKSSYISYVRERNYGARAMTKFAQLPQMMTVLLCTVTGKVDLAYVFIFIWSVMKFAYSVVNNGGGGPTTKKTKDILRFSRRHDLFCSFLFSV